MTQELIMYLVVLFLISISNWWGNRFSRAARKVQDENIECLRSDLDIHQQFILRQATALEHLAPGYTEDYAAFLDIVLGRIRDREARKRKKMGMKAKDPNPLQ